MTPANPKNLMNSAPKIKILHFSSSASVSGNQWPSVAKEILCVLRAFAVQIPKTKIRKNL
jgi:hypothetical protein